LSESHRHFLPSYYITSHFLSIRLPSTGPVNLNADPQPLSRGVAKHPKKTGCTQTAITSTSRNFARNSYKRPLAPGQPGNLTSKHNHMYEEEQAA
jgi:hypothetical protein